ncbi:hypothetical protein LOAG_08626 [Loa loa]|uniref:Uncharacterized protein n=1 Tax=Loa loa TaxID=7209 RepID=A0A1S0TUW5_LOALO|nr:hypothetical protein LOAG_08626 [Loa loa]EFO19866.2 hypothetical protein LOAG_08626 [Loa loa]
MKIPERANKSKREAIRSAKFLTARSAEDERKRSNESVFFLKKKKPLPNKVIDSEPKIQQIYYRSSSRPMMKKARSSTQFRPIYSSPVYPITPQYSSKQKTKHKFVHGSSEKGNILTAGLPEGSSSSTYIRKSDSSMDERKYV